MAPTVVMAATMCDAIAVEVLVVAIATIMRRGPATRRGGRIRGDRSRTSKGRTIRRRCAMLLLLRIRGDRGRTIRDRLLTGVGD